jgi:hypothetical protein
MSSTEVTQLVSPIDLLSEARRKGLQVVAAGNRLIVRGPPDADQALVRALLACKPELMPLLQREAGTAFGCATAKRVPSGLVRQRRGNLVRLAGLNGWLSIRDLRPCSTCGGTRFRVGRRRLFCANCLQPQTGEYDAAEIDVAAILAHEEMQSGVLEPDA